MKMTRRDFIHETFRELASPFVSGLRFLSAGAHPEQAFANSGWKKVGTLFALTPGSCLELKELQLEVLSDENGLRATQTKNSKKQNHAIEIRKSNEVWVNLKEAWSPQAYLCHLTLLKKEE